MNRKVENIRKNSVFFGILLLAGLVLFQAQTFYGKRRTGFFQTKEEGAPFGYYVPRTIQDGKSYPLVVIFGKKVTDVMKWKEVATTENLIVLAIQPKIGSKWSSEWDINRALDKIRDVKNRYPVDPKRVWATGYKNGGNFALAMTINHPEIFSAGSVSNAKTINTAEAGTEKKYVISFDYSNKAERQRPLWIMNFKKSGFVSIDDLKGMSEIFSKYGYPATLKTVEGEAGPPTGKVIQEMYEWLKARK